MKKPEYLRNCFHPIKVYTPQGEKYVPCGQCPACLRMKSSQNVDNIVGFAQDNATDFPYMYFITLTYSNENLPLALYDAINNNISPISSQDFGIRNGKTYSCYASPKTLNNAKKLGSLHHSKEHSYYVPVLNRKHIQLFIKTLRNNLDYEKEEIKHYCVGEYGPRHLRPHYHIIIFCKSDIYKFLRENLSSFWSLGFCNLKRSTIGTAQYIAKYVCSTASLPSYLKTKGFRPFSHHSQFMYKTASKERITFDESFYDKLLTGYNVQRNGATNKALYSLTYQRRIFPKCYNFDCTNIAKTYDTLTLYNELLEKDFSKFFTMSVRQYVEYIYKKYNSKYFTFSNAYTTNRLVFADSERLIRALYLSKAFIKLCKEQDITHLDMVRNIHLFYNYQSNFVLSRFYQSQEDYTANESLYPEDVFTFGFTRFYDLELFTIGNKLSLFHKDPYKLQGYNPEEFPFLPLNVEFENFDNSHLFHQYELQEDRTIYYNPQILKFYELFSYDLQTLLFNPPADIPAINYRCEVTKRLNEDVKHKLLNDYNRSIFNPENFNKNVS
ncbi:replication initiator protein [Capybara microvirus Cap1_SP_82]|nr:replication initiator protein [Capybara microvirus Cap1_SP_82]